MFLSELNNTEKEAFMSLSVHASKSNGVLDEAEKQMIQEYCREMNLNEFDDSKMLSMDEITSIFRKSSKKIKRIVALEILGLVYSDGTYDASEASFINNFAMDIELSKDIINNISEVVVKYINILVEVTEVIKK